MKIVVAQIQTFTPHPKDPKLKICQVTTEDMTTQVVCGASNVREKMKTILAPLGSITPQGLSIISTRIRGVESHGMLCSAKDLGLSLDSEIIDLPESTVLGTPYEQIPMEQLSVALGHEDHDYREVESFWQEKQGKQIIIVRQGQNPPDDQQYQLISKTYVNGEKFLYRNFLYSNSN